MIHHIKNLKIRLKLYILIGVALLEIGRASCRERV